MLIIIVSCNSKKRKTKSSQRNLNTTIVKPDAKKKYAETQSLNELQKCVSANRKILKMNLSELIKRKIWIETVVTKKDFFLPTRHLLPIT